MVETVRLTPETMPRRPPHRILLAPFGYFTRYLLGAYLKNIFMVAGALMTIALTIDLWPQIALLMQDTARGPLSLVWTVMKLACLRIPDLLPPFIPFATFLGVVWAETAFTTSLERMLIWNSGRTPIQCLMPALLAGLLAGATLFVMDVWLRPAAIHVQMDERLGREGVRLDRSQTGASHWIALPDGLLRAEIQYGPPLRLDNVTIYKLDGIGHLREVDTAVQATPLPGTDRWLLTDGRYWRGSEEQSGALNLGAGLETETSFRTRAVDMHLNILWLRNLGLSPQYLTLPVLDALAHSSSGSHDDGGFRTRWQAIFGEVFLPVAMALLGAALSLLYFAYGIAPLLLIGVLLAGYLAHFAYRAFLLMGEFEYIPSWLAGWLVPLAVFAAVGLVILRIQQIRGQRLRDLFSPNSG
jgi:lipopolysaccharide export LptBFGC system permease protein LptF